MVKRLKHCMVPYKPMFKTKGESYLQERDVIKISNLYKVKCLGKEKKEDKFKCHQNSVTEKSIR